MQSLNKFGALAALAIVLAFVLDILVSPALMRIGVRFGIMLASPIRRLPMSRIIIGGPQTKELTTPIK